MVERKPFVVNGRWWLGGRAGGWVALGGPRVVERRPVREIAKRGGIVKVWDDHDALDRWDLHHDLAHPRQAVDLLPRISIPVGAEEHLRLDLAEPIQHALHAEVRRAR